MIAGGGNRIYLASFVEPPPRQIQALSLLKRRLIQLERRRISEIVIR